MLLKPLDGGKLGLFTGGSRTPAHSVCMIRSLRRALIGASALLCLDATAATPVATSTASAVRARVLDLVNDARARGRRCGEKYFSPSGALRESDRLRDAAAHHAKDMARRNYFDHHAQDGSEPRDRVRRTGYKWSLIGENIAFGPESAEEAVEGWLASPGHCANIMDPRFRDTGIAVAKGRKRGYYYWVQEFGQPAR